MWRIYSQIMVVGILALAGCTRHNVKVEPIEVKPITVNVNVRIDRELDEFFDYEEELTSQPSNKAGDR